MIISLADYCACVCAEAIKRCFRLIIFASRFHNILMPMPLDYAISLSLPATLMLPPLLIFTLILLHERCLMPLHFVYAPPRERCCPYVLCRAFARRLCERALMLLIIFRFYVFRRLY